MAAFPSIKSMGGGDCRSDPKIICLPYGTIRIWMVPFFYFSSSFYKIRPCYNSHHRVHRMIHLVIYLVSAYFIVGIVIYIWGHPLRDRVAAPAKTAYTEGKTNVLYRHLAHSAQAVNFLVHSVSVVAREQTSAPIATLYRESVRRAFDPKHLFITTGAPHSRGLYLRNFAWFYPDLLNPATIIDEADRKNRLILLERSLRTALETMGARPYTTTIVPLTVRRFAAVNYMTPSLRGLSSLRPRRMTPAIPPRRLSRNTKRISSGNSPAWLDGSNPSS